LGAGHDVFREESEDQGTVQSNLPLQEEE